MPNDDFLYLEFEDWWSSLAHPWDEYDAKVAAWQAWQFANWRVASEIKYAKGINERCQGFNEAMEIIHKLVGDKP